MGSLHVLEGTMNAEKYIKVLEQHMLPSRRRLFQGRPCVFHRGANLSPFGEISRFHLEIGHSRESCKQTINDR